MLLERRDEKRVVGDHNVLRIQRSRRARIIVASIHENTAIQDDILAGGGQSASKYIMSTYLVMEEALSSVVSSAK